MDALQDSSRTMLGLNARLKGFMEQVNRLQEANRWLEAQIADWSIRSASRSQDWVQQEEIVKELRAQVRTSSGIITTGKLQERSDTKGFPENDSHLEYTLN